MTKVVLGLDPSQTRTGWSVFKQGTDLPIWGHLEFPPWKDDEAVYIEQFHRFLTEKIVEHKVTHVVPEQTFMPIRKKGFKNDTMAVRFAQFALLAIIMLVARQQCCEIFTANIADWRMRWIGTAQSPPSYGAGTSASTRWFKERAMATANRQGWYTADDNEAEALGIGDYGMCCIDPRYTEATRARAAREQLITYEIMRGER